MKRQLATALSLLAAATIAGCATTGSDRYAGVTVCQSNCQTPIGLSMNMNEPPSVPDVTRIKDGEPLNFRIVNAPRGTARTVLSFDTPAFLDNHGNPVYTLELDEGNNLFNSRPYSDGVCHAPRGCRFVVINTGAKGRPSIINSPTLIIDPR